MSARQRLLLLAVSLLLVGCEAVATTAPRSNDTVDNPGQTPMKDSL
jgi:photosystem II stability/assembly factor-like uncharacterized protein